jgi:hypothetical protein
MAAEKIAEIFPAEDSQPLYNVWIKSFLNTFVKKWSLIDFLRMDKYIMLVESILQKFIDEKINNSLFSDIFLIFDFIKEVINTSNYNFSFITTLHKTIAQLVGKFNDNLYTAQEFDLLVKNLIEVNYFIFK